MRRFFVIIVLIVLFVTSIHASENSWDWYAAQGDEYYFKGDYNVAWLFYEKAMSSGLDDGLVLFRAAQAFEHQVMTRNAEFGKNLYAVAYYYISQQYPEDPAAAEAEHRTPTKNVSRRLIRRTYMAVSSDAPRRRKPVIAEVSSNVENFLAERFAVIQEFFTRVLQNGFGDAFTWVRANLSQFILSLLIVNFLTGILIPTVIAIAVAREGRKSYVSAYFFLVHWGLLGVHRFYIGRYVSGIVWLLTGGLLGVGVFFDLFLTGAYVRFWNEDNRDKSPKTSARRLKQNRKSAPKRALLSRPSKKSARQKKQRKNLEHFPPTDNSISPKEEFSFDTDLEADQSDQNTDNFKLDNDDQADIPDMNFDNDDNEFFNLDESDLNSDMSLSEDDDDKSENV